MSNLALIRNILWRKYFLNLFRRTVESVAKLHSLTLNKVWRQIFNLISFQLKQIFNLIHFQLKQIFNLISLQLKQRTVESVAKLHSLTLHGNPWACDCHLRPLLNWLQVKIQNIIKVIWSIESSNCHLRPLLNWLQVKIPNLLKTI